MSKKKAVKAVQELKSKNNEKVRFGASEKINYAAVALTLFAQFRDKDRLAKIK